MEKSHYTIYIDYAINSNQPFDPMNSPDEVLEARKLNVIDVNSVDNFHNLFLHLSEQFNEQTDIIGLKDKVNLKIVRNDENNYFIVYYECIVDDIQRLPIKALDNYLNIIVDKSTDIIYGLDNALEVNLSIPDEPHILSLSWYSESYDSEITVGQEEENRYSLLSSSYNRRTNIYEYALNNGWVIEAILKDEVTLNVK